MNRRGFLAAMLGAASAPAIVKAESLMKIVVPKQEIIVFGRKTPTQVDGVLSKAYIGDTEINYMYDRMPEVSEDGIVISNLQLAKLNFATYEKRAIQFGANRYPIDLYGR